MSKFIEISEQQLEEVITHQFNTQKYPIEYFIEKGFDFRPSEHISTKAKPVIITQTNLGFAGRSDIILGFPVGDGSKWEATVIELKKDSISMSSIGQVLRYATALEVYHENITKVRPVVMAAYIGNRNKRTAAFDAIISLYYIEKLSFCVYDFGVDGLEFMDFYWEGKDDIKENILDDDGCIGGKLNSLELTSHRDPTTSLFIESPTYPALLTS
jgi:hypothetical protein